MSSLTRLRIRLINWFTGFSSYLDPASRSLHRIQQKIAEHTQTVEPNYSGWGQYIEQSSTYESGQRGVYGTSSAIQILSLGERTEFKKEVIEGTNWLRREWTDSESHISNRWHQSILYKHVDFLNGVWKAEDRIDDPNSFAESNPNVDESISRLWKKKVEWDRSFGWGEYYYSDDSGPLDYNRDEPWSDDPDILSTAYGMYGILRSRNEFNLSVITDICSELADKVVQRGRNSEDIETQALVTEVALCLLILGELKQKFGDQTPTIIEKNIKEVATLLESLIEEREAVGPHQYYEHFFTTPHPEFQNNYVIFLFNPIVCLAFFSAGRKYVGRNFQYISNTVDEYINEIGTDDRSSGAYTAKKTGLQSVRDHLWISLFLHEFSNLDIQTIRLRDVATVKIRSAFQSQLFLFIFLIIVTIGAYASAQGPDETFYSLTSYLLTIIAGAILTSMGLPKIIEDILDRR